MEEETATLEQESTTVQVVDDSEQTNANDNSEDLSELENKLAADLGNSKDIDFEAPEEGGDKRDDEEEEEDAEEEEDELPESTPELRKAFKGQKKEIRELKAELEKKTADQGVPGPAIDFTTPTGIAPGEVPQAPVAPQTAEPTMSPEFAVTTLMGIKNGTEDEKFRAPAVQRLQAASPAEILAVIDKADANGYGDDSSDISSLATAELTKATARQAGQQAVDAERNAVMQERSASVAKVNAMEGMDDKESPQFKQLEKDAEELNKFVPNFFDLYPQAPEMVVWYQGMKADGGTGELTKLRTENAELKETIAKSRSPQSSSQQANVSVDKNAEEALGDALEGLAAGG